MDGHRQINALAKKVGTIFFGTCGEAAGSWGAKRVPQKNHASRRPLRGRFFAWAETTAKVVAEQQTQKNGSHRSRCPASLRAILAPFLLSFSMSRFAYCWLLAVSIWLLAGCGPDASTQLAKCEIEGMNLYARLAGDPAMGGAAIAAYVATCMKVHGYKPNYDRRGCSNQAPKGKEMNPACYERQSWFS
jgi:hypothetical protein